VPSSPGLGLVFILNRLRVMGFRLNEYHAPIVTAGLVGRNEFHGIGLYANLLGQGLDKLGRGTSGTHLAVTRARTARVSDMTQRYTPVVLRSLANCPADVERREQRVAIHWNKISTAPPSHGPVIRTPTHEEIEADVYESVRQDGDLYRSRSETPLRNWKMGTHRNKGGYGAEAGQHPRLNRERDLWRG